MTTLPRCSDLRSPLMTPDSIRGMMPSDTISLCTPRSRLSPRQASTALGMAPIPICSVAPSGISRGDMVRDGHVQIGVRLGRKFGERTRGLDDGGHLGDVQEAIAEAAGHLIVDFNDDVPGAAGGGEGAIDAGAEAHIAVLVRGRCLEESNVERQGSGGEQFLDFAKGKWGYSRRGLHTPPGVHWSRGKDRDGGNGLHIAAASNRLC